VETVGFRSVEERARADTTENISTHKEGCTGECKNTRITVVMKVRRLHAQCSKFLSDFSQI